ncbi:MAG TPA: MgtC/SapB family protein [Polyangiaceae bacterium]|jgi:putative Mg2+ transporter-C (MgtC) family protein
MLSHYEMIGRIVAGAALGSVIGYERDRHRRPVGLRTHLIVAMAAASFMVISSQFVYFQHYAERDLVEVDTSRIAASVVSAVGFLAGGAILRTGATVQGLTTAAGLWLVTAIGMCAGSGMFVESAAITLLGIIALTALRRFEDKNLLRRQLSIVLSDGAADLDVVVSALKAIGVSAEDVKYDKRLDDEKKRVVATLDIEFADTVALPRLVAAVEAVHGVRRVVVQRSS